jgi:hypothetical protein
MSVIFGGSGDSSTILSEAFDAVEAEKDSKKKDQAVKLYKLLLSLNSFDLQLMQTTLKASKNEKVLDMKKITDELQMLQAFCGKEEKYALVLIDWESEYTFANGCRSPPWRQLYGELCYIKAQCRDREKIILTATKSGFFINKGYSVDAKGVEHLNYEKESNVFASITDLLRSHSPHFASKIDKQVYLYEEDETAIFTAQAAETVSTEKHDVTL